MTRKIEFTTADFVILKAARKWKILWFLKKGKFFGPDKILPTQTSNLAICPGIFPIPMQIAIVAACAFATVWKFQATNVNI